MKSLIILKTTKILSITFLLLPFLAFSQQNKIDSLWAVLQSQEVANMPYAELYKIQKAYIQQTTNNPAKRVEQLTRASLFFLQHHPDTSMVLSNEAEKIAETSNNDVLRAMAYVSKSAVYSVNDNVEMIMQYALKALAISEKTTLEPDIMASMYRKFGRVYRDQNDDRASIEAYKKALAFSTNANNLKDICGTAGTMGQIYGKLNLYDSAIIHLKQALDLSKKIGYNDNIVRGHIHLMNLYDDINKIPEAFVTLKEMEYWLNNKDISPVIKCLAYTCIADLDLRHGNSNQQLAKRYLDSMERLLIITKPGTENLVDYYLGRSLLEYSRQNYDMGAAALTKYHEFKQIMDNQLIEGHSQELAAKYETGKKDALIKNLNIERIIRYSNKRRFCFVHFIRYLGTPFIQQI
jgi:tetratricopeptide (TPR) repeat protein